MKCKNFSYHDWKKMYSLMKIFCEDNKEFKEFCAKMKSNRSDCFGDKSKESPEKQTDQV